MTSEQEVEFVEVGAGTFMMGARPEDKFGDATERPLHEVQIAYRFAFGKYPVTNAQYRQLSPAHEEGKAPNLPAVNVNWDDARHFCQMLDSEWRRGCRLPSEAEWEYVCRAGATGPFSTGDSISLVEANYLYDETGRRVGFGALRPSTEFPPNPFGVYDLHGNVCEWVGDSWRPNYLGAPVDGSVWTPPAGSSDRVIRGGAWDFLPRLLRSSWRDSLPASSRRDNVSFRVALTLT